MQRLLKVIGISIFSLFLVVETTEAVWWRQKKTEKKEEEKITEEKKEEVLKKETAPPSAIVLSGEEAREEAETKAREILSSREWAIYLTPMGKKQKRHKMKDDRLVFSKNTVTSQGLSNQGYATSNYTVKVEDKTIVWETMQNNEKGDLAFWRGELKGVAMRGILSMQSAKGEIKDFSFTTVRPERAKEGK